MLKTDGANLIMLRFTSLLIFVQELRFCTFRDMGHKSHAVDSVEPEEISATRAIETFSSSFPVNTQRCCTEKPYTERSLSWSKEGRDRYVTNKCFVQVDQSSTTGKQPLLRMVTRNGESSFKTPVVMCPGNGHWTNRNTCHMPWFQVEEILLVKELVLISRGGRMWLGRDCDTCFLRALLYHRLNGSAGSHPCQGRHELARALAENVDYGIPWAPDGF